MLPLFQDSPSRWFSRQVPSWGWGWRCCCGAAPILYHIGGNNGSDIVTADRTNTGTEVSSAVSGANLPVGKSEMGPVGEPAVSGYFAGGRTSGPTGVVATAHQLTFSTETTAAVASANLSTTRSGGAGLSERSTKGYFLGGGTSTAFSGARVVTADKLVFSTGTTAAQASANLSAARYAISGLTEGSTKGYVGGGQTGALAYIATSDKVTFASDTTAAQASANLTIARTDYSSMSNGSTKGYWAGGQTGGASGTCEKVTFSTDTTAALTTTSTNRWGANGSATGPYGYAASGIDPGFVTSIAKWDFATDLFSGMVPGASLSVGRLRLSGVSTVGL